MMYECVLAYITLKYHCIILRPLIDLNQKNDDLLQVGRAATQ